MEEENMNTIDDQAESFLRSTVNRLEEITITANDKTPYRKRQQVTCSLQKRKFDDVLSTIPAEHAELVAKEVKKWKPGLQSNSEKRISQEIAEREAISSACLDAQRLENPFGIHDEEIVSPAISKLTKYVLPEENSAKRHEVLESDELHLPKVPTCSNEVNKSSISKYDISPSYNKSGFSSYRLPDVKVEVFDGNPLRFPAWETAFDALVENTSTCTAQRLNLLQHNVRGEPKAMIDGLFLLQTEDAYREARTKLKERYGNNSIICGTFLDKIHVWPKIPPNDARALRVFSDFVNQVVVAKRKFTNLNILDFPTESAKIVTRLPPHISCRWKDTVILWKTKHNGSYPPFETLAKFITDHAERENIPELQGIYAQVKGRRQNDMTNPRGVNSFAAWSDSSSPVPKCFYCKKYHHLDECKDFMNITRTERMSFLRTNELLKVHNATVQTCART
ncbi:uncharacterized protein LOC144743465 [Ciona intestinalis]